MKLETYIYELLKENENVIIPGFGAFFSEYKPAEISETEIKPPSKRISFSSNIRNNDGVLVDCVAKTEKVSHFDALKTIEKERDNIVFLLDKGEEVALEEIGRLSLNDKNEIEFIANHNENASIENFGLETISLEKLEEIHQEPGISEVIPSFERSVAETNQEGDPNESKETTKSEVIANTPPVDNESMPDSREEELEETRIGEHEEITENENHVPAKEPVFDVKNEAEPEKEEKKKTGWYWYLLILIPIIAAGIFVVRNITGKESGLTNSNHTEIQQNRQNEMQTEEKSVVAKDSIEAAQEEVLTQDSATTILTENEAKTDSFAGQTVYYLIGGSFKESEERALAYMEELKEKGFNPFYMGKQGNFYTVGIGKYKTEGQAIRTRDTIWLKYPEWNLWVMEE